MSITAVDWHTLLGLPTDSLKDEIFSILREAALEIQNGELDDPDLLAVVPRLAALAENRPDLANFGGAFSALARSVGLWNYIDKSVADARDELAAELATVPELGVVLH